MLGRAVERTLIYDHHVTRGEIWRTALGLMYVPIRGEEEISIQLEWHSLERCTSAKAAVRYYYK